MSFFENLRMAFSSIMANKMRSLLTMLGIIIGISAVITITTLGTTLRSTVKGALDSLGSNIFFVSLNQKDYEDDTVILNDEDCLSIEMFNDLTERYPDEFQIALSNPFSDATILNSDNKTITVNMVGGFDGTLAYNNLKILAGRNLTMRDSKEKKHTCCVSDIFVGQYFKKGENPVGKVVEFSLPDGQPIEFTIVGVYKYSVAAFGVFPANTKEIDKKTPVYIPYTVSNQFSGQYDDVMYYASFMYNTDYDNAVAEADLTKFFDEQYAENKDWGVIIENVQEEMKMIDMVISIITIIVSVIAAISLIVGGVGVMNIMLVSVTERTREIGVRKALGAKKRSIKRQFVTEAVIICLIGGIIGIICGILNGEIAGLIVNYIVKTNPEYVEVLGTITIVPSVGAIIISLVFSTLTGVFFGLYPAGKAAKMNPIDALRYD